MSHFPSFQTATNLLSSSNNPINNSNNIDNIQDAAQIKASYYRKKAKVKNTEKSTKSWSTKFEEFRACAGYSVPLTDLKDISQLQKQIVEFISTMKMKNGNEYKATSVKQSVDALNRYLLHLSPIPQINLHDKYMFPDLHDVLHGKLRDLQEHGFGETLGSVAINSQQIQQILQYPKITTDNPKGLLYRGQAYIISIPADNNGPCSDIQLYLSKRPPSGDENFYLQPNNTSWLETNIWYKTDHIGKNKLGNFMKKIGRETQIDIPIELLSNHSGRKTATQILQDQEVPEQAIMQLTGHKNVQGVRAYKKDVKYDVRRYWVQILRNRDISIIYGAGFRLDNNLTDDHQE
ncbi:activating transcription factor 7-interacting protein 1 isoform X1 [Rhizophagus irregularis DAOM 181602=DAOM 197198]|nr:activating transcription factor 7-interacting protein 1 isoform X1 [Rhizophagus irregularis DAOM 181602=DAOM 197198]